MDSQALVAHILSQTKQNIEFLMTQHQISETNGRDILAKLPPIQISSTPAQLTHHMQNLSVSSLPQTRLDSSPAPNIAAHPLPTGPAALFRGRALWSYNEQGQDPNDLSFHAGDVIDIIAETNADWWTGSHNGKHGLFPSNYVERLPPSTAPGPPAPTPYASPPSYGGPEKTSAHSTAPPSPFPSYQPAGGYQPPPPGGAYNPYGGPAQPQAPQGNTVVVNSEQPPKKGKFGGKFGSTLAHSAVGGVGFGAGSAVGSGIINSIF